MIKFLKKKQWLVAITLLVILFPNSVFALNVTDDLDMNRGDAYNFTELRFPSQTYTSPFLDVDGVLGTPFGFTIDLTKSSTGTAAPFNFAYTYTGTGAATALVTEGSVKWNQNANVVFTGYGDRRTLGSGTSVSQTQGTRTYYSQRSVFNPPFLNGGNWNAYEVYHAPYTLTQLSGTANVLDVGFYTAPPTVTISLGTLNLDAYGYRCGDYSNTSDYDNIWCFHNPYSNSWNMLKGHTVLENLTNGTDWVTMSELIDVGNNPGDFDLVTTPEIYSDIGIDNSIDLFDSGTGCMDFTVDGRKIYSLCSDSIPMGDDLIPDGVNVTYDLGSLFSYWWKDVSAQRVITETYQTVNGSQGIDYVANLTDSAGSPCTLTFNQGLLIGGDCDGAASATATSPFELGIDEEDQEQSRLPIIFIP